MRRVPRTGEADAALSGEGPLRSAVLVDVHRERDETFLDPALAGAVAVLVEDLLERGIDFDAALQDGIPDAVADAVAAVGPQHEHAVLRVTHPLAVLVVLEDDPADAVLRSVLRLQNLQFHMQVSFVMVSLKVFLRLDHVLARSA